MVQSIGSTIQQVSVEEDDGSKRKCFRGVFQFEAQSHGDLVLLLQIIGLTLGELEEQGDTGQQPGDVQQPQQDQPKTEDPPARRKRVQRTQNAQEVASEIAAGAAALDAGKSMTTEELQQKIAADVFHEPSPIQKAETIPAPAPVQAPPAPPPAPAKPASLFNITDAMRTAVKPRDVVRALFDQDTAASRTLSSVADVWAWCRDNKDNIPCFASMSPESYKERIETITETIRESYMI